MQSKGLFFLLSLLVLSTSTCWGHDIVSSPTNLAIHTYGGGELLERIFNAISMLIYGNSESGIDKTFNSILRIGLAIGGFCSICLAFFREKFDPLVKNFFLPGIAIMCCILVPRTTVYIQDHFAQKIPSTKAIAFTKVENVPFFLGHLASLVSTISYQLTSTLEGVAHGVNDQLYDWTGHIYAGENLFQANKCRISNPVLEDNFREFCRECVFRDLGLGIYSKESLVTTPNILEFLEKNTSRIRTVYYREVNDKNNTNSGSFMPCREAIKKMNSLFNHSAGNTKDILIGEIGSDFQFLLNQKKSGEADLRNLVKQQIAINLLKEEVPGTLNSFASKRAELLQKENQKILGALGANSIVATRNFFEATIYMVFPIIILICLISFGLKPLINWVHFILWVNMWPPFYVVVKFLLNAIWEFRTKHAFGDDFGLTIFTSEGLSDLYSSMESIAAISLAFIPFLSWILLKGGVSQMVQLASSIMSPAQSAATTASSEKVYGNYSFGNVNLENVNGYNAQTFRQTYSGLLSTGSVGVDTGTETMTYTPNQDALYVRQSDSHLREGISRTQSFSGAVQESLSTSQTALQENSQSFSDNLADTSNKAVGLVSALSNQFQKGDTYTTQTSSGLQEAVQYMEGIGSDYAHSTGVNSDQGLREVISAGIGKSFFGIKGSFDGSYQDGVSAFEGDSSSHKAFDSESFQKHLQTLINASSSEVGSILKGEDVRLHNDFVQSFNETQTSSEQWRASYSEHEALSNLKSYSESEQVAIHQNLNQRFVEFLQDKYHDGGKINSILEMPNETPEKDTLIREFVGHLIPNDSRIGSDSHINDTYSNYLQNAPSVTRQAYDEKSSDFIYQGEQKLKHSYGEIEPRVEEFKSLIKGQHHTDTTDLQVRHTTTEQAYAAQHASTDASLDTSITSHFIAESSILSPARYVINKFTGKNPQPTRDIYQELYGSTESVQPPQD